MKGEIMLTELNKNLNLISRIPKTYGEIQSNATKNVHFQFYPFPQN